MEWVESKQHWRKRGRYKEHNYEFTSKKPERIVEKIRSFEQYIDNDVLLDMSMTLWQYVQRWYPTRVAGLKPKTIEVIDNIVNNHILPKLGNIPISSIKPLHIDELFLALDGKSASLRRKILNNLQMVFDSALENNIINKSPISNRRKAGGEKARKKIPLTDAEIRTLVEAVRGSRAELFTLLCLCTGLRREEALGLLWTNVHVNTPTPYLTVCNTVTFTNNGRPKFSPDLKTDAAFRQIPLPPYLTEALIRRRGENDSLFVVPAAGTCSEMTLSSFDRMWGIVVGYTRKDVAKRDKDGKIVKDSAGKTIKEKKHYPGLVDFHVTPHLLRHTYISILCASGLDIKKIQYLAGHANVQTTLDIYAEVRDNKPEDLAPYIENILDDILVANEPEQALLEARPG